MTRKEEFLKFLNTCSDKSLAMVYHLCKRYMPEDVEKWAETADGEFIAGVVAELNEDVTDVEQMLANRRERDAETARLKATRKWLKTARTLYFDFHKDLWGTDKPDGTYGVDYVLVRRGVTFLFQELNGKYVGHTATTQTNFIEFSSQEAMLTSGWFEEVSNEN